VAAAEQMDQAVAGYGLGANRGSAIQSFALTLEKALQAKLGFAKKPFGCR
jgi:hypothetical protein